MWQQQQQQQQQQQNIKRNLKHFLKRESLWKALSELQLEHEDSL